jgi:hypothetical protein
MSDAINVLLSPIGIALAAILLLLALRFLFPKETSDLIRRLISIRFPGGRIEAVPPDSTISRTSVSDSVEGSPGASTSSKDSLPGTIPLARDVSITQDDEISAIKRRRLHELRKKQALMGRGTPPEDLIEIEQLVTELREMARGGR